ncbi:MAG: subclass B3 metallo-beta-lactamase [Chakrabartia sp.]
MASLLKTFTIFIGAVTAAYALAATGAAPLASDAVIEAAEKESVSADAQEGRWNEPYAPFKLIGNIHYVGTAGISAYLITTPKGHFLIDGILPQTAPLIIANIKALGFRIGDVKYLLNTHAHFDHAGGLARLQRASGAIMVASAADKPFLEAGDIGHGPSSGIKFPPVRVDHIVRDGEKLSLGGVTLTAHMTPGHSPGCTSWSLDAVGADKQRKRVFLNCSETVAGQSLVPEAYTGIVANFRATFAKVRKMKADIFLANHDMLFDLHAKRARQIAGDANAFVDPSELQLFNTEMEQAFETKLKNQKGNQK